MPQPQDLDLALLQMDLDWESPEANFACALRLTERLSADVIVLPEMFSTGFTMQPAPVAEPVKGPAFAFMRELSASKNALVMGSVVVQDGDSFYNRLYAVEPSGQVATYDKRHLFRMAGEHERYTGGSSSVTLQWRGWNIRPLICYDLRFPVWSRNSLPDQGYDLLVYVANWPARRAEHWKLLLQARAVENQAFCAGVNRVGTDGNDIEYKGDSMIVDPLGKTLRHEQGREVVITARLNRKELDDYREKFPAWMDADDFMVVD